MPNVANVSRARVVGKKIFDILERQPLIQSSIDDSNYEGTEKISIKSNIKF